MEYKIEHDSMGEVKVPADRYWGAQTQRSHENFEIGVDIETMPREITKAFGYLKKAAAIANQIEVRVTVPISTIIAVIIKIPHKTIKGHIIKFPPSY